MSAAPATAATEEEVLLRAEALRKDFDVSRPWLERVVARLPRRRLRAVDDVSLAITPGETYALVGESGSGKSTVARMVVGLLAPTGGSVRYRGGLQPGDPRLAGKVQMIFQDPFASLNPRWRVADIIGEPIAALGLMPDAQARAARVGELLALVGLSPTDGRRFPHEFSGGQRQRIAIARALSSNPGFIVCDEPTSALDVSVQAQILNLMRDLQAELGLTYLFISHNLAVVRHMAHRIGVMYLGRLVETRPGAELFSSPRHPYTRLLLEAVPDVSAIGHTRAPLQGEVPSPIAPPPGCTFHPRCPLANERCRREVPALRDGVACHAVEEGRAG